MVREALDTAGRGDQSPRPDPASVSERLPEGSDRVVSDWTLTFESWQEVALLRILLRRYLRAADSRGVTGEDLRARRMLERLERLP